MAFYLKKFSTHQEYENYINGSGAILPNVSICTTEVHVHYNPLKCEETTTYELVGTPSYPSEVDGADTSFDMTFNYKRTDINEKCKETITEGSDTVTVEIGANPSTSASRTVSGTVTWNGNDIEYNITQSKFAAKITAKFNVTTTSSPTKIAYRTSGFSAIEIDGVVQPSVVSAYTFDTVGEHTVKYTLKNPTSIGDNAFSACTNLTSCTIGSGVISIGQYAFSFCGSLTSIDIPNSVTSILTAAFANCSGLTSINIPDSVTSIGGSAFNECSGLTSIVIPSGVTSISSGAFGYCTSLTSVTISSGVTVMYNYAFAYCSGLTSIICNATTAPTIQRTTFQDAKRNGTLYVPIGSSGYDVWMGTGNYYLGKYSWTKVEQ